MGVDDLFTYLNLIFQGEISVFGVFCYTMVYVAIFAICTDVSILLYILVPVSDCLENI